MTLSILAFDEATSAFGVAVASRALAVGARVPHLRAGVGGAVVQAFAPFEWGPLALDLFVHGASATDVAAELERQPRSGSAQVALLDSAGSAAGFTGEGCEPEAGIAFGSSCCSAANLMEKPDVPEAVVATFETSAGPSLAERLLLALSAGDALGGDIRGRQSASLTVLAPPGTGTADVDLRVDDSRAPVAELRRLLTLHQADALVASSADADGHYRDVEPLLRAVALAPDDLGCVSALALALLRAGRVDQAIPHLAHLKELEPRTPARLQRLIDTGHLDPQIGQAAMRRLSRD